MSIHIETNVYRHGESVEPLHIPPRQRNYLPDGTFTAGNYVFRETPNGEMALVRLAKSDDQIIGFWRERSPDTFEKILAFWR